MQASRTTAGVDPTAGLDPTAGVDPTARVDAQRERNTNLRTEQQQQQSEPGTQPALHSS